MWSWSLIPGCFVCYAKHMLSHWAVPQPLLLLLKSQLAVGIIQFEICQLNKWYHILIYYSYFSPEWWNVSASSKIVSLGIVEIIYTQCKHFHDKMNELKTFFFFSSLFSVYVCAFLLPHVACRGQKRASEPLEQELQLLVTPPTL